MFLYASRERKKAGLPDILRNRYVSHEGWARKWKWTWRLTTLARGHLIILCTLSAESSTFFGQICGALPSLRSVNTSGTGIAGHCFAWYSSGGTIIVVLVAK